MQDPFEDTRNTSGGMSLRTFLIGVALMVVAMLVLANLDVDGPEPSTTPSATVSPR